MVRRLLRIAGAVGLVLVLLLVGRLAFLSVDSHMNKPPRSSPAEGLKPCPDRPNCVSSQAEDAGHRVEALAVSGDVDTALDRAQTAIEEAGGRVTEISGGYLHAEFVSRIFKFKDDLELLYDSGRGVFDVRSASRVGHSDLGVNRRRVEDLRSRLAGSE